MASIGGAFGGSRGATPVPPEQGVFPLDHFHECDEPMNLYMKCLREHKFDSEKCRHLSKIYLVCRMDKNLMAKQDLKELGFRDGDDPKQIGLQGSQAPAAADRSREKLREGFVAGIPSSSRRP